MKELKMFAILSCICFLILCFAFRVVAFTQHDEIKKYQKILIENNLATYTVDIDGHTEFTILEKKEGK